MHTQGMSIRSSLGFLAAVTVLCLAPARSRTQAPTQEQAAPPDSQPAAIIKKESRPVLVDAVVTDKKGNYVHDLAQKDFKVYEDNKKQAVTSFSFGSDPLAPLNPPKRYIVLFFDNSSMAPPDQIQARAAATKFIEKSVSPDRLI